MSEFIQISAFFGVFLSLAAYAIGTFLRNKTRHALCNPLLVAVLLVMAVLLLLDIPYESYNRSTQVLQYLLTPATVCLAIPLYEKLQLLRKNAAAILIGITAGVLTSLCSVFCMALLFGLNHAEYVTLLPKSITSAIGMSISSELGGYPSITVTAICITGLLGNISAELVLRLGRVTDPIARGVAIGTSSHAIGTARAMELGEVEGAMSGLSIVVAGILTVVGASIFAQFI